MHALQTATAAGCGWAAIPYDFGKNGANITTSAGIIVHLSRCLETLHAEGMPLRMFQSNTTAGEIVILPCTAIA
jgi:hypothetical protein